MHFVSNRVEVEQQTGDIMTDKLLSIDCFYIGTVLEWDGATASVDVCHNFVSLPPSLTVYQNRPRSAFTDILILIIDLTLKSSLRKQPLSQKKMVN